MMLFASISVIVLLNLIDLVGSIYFLKKNLMAEANRLAAWIWDRWGAWGFVVYKGFLLTAFVVVILIADYQGSWMVWWAIGICAVASLYPVVLLGMLWILTSKFK